MSLCTVLAVWLAGGFPPAADQTSRFRPVPPEDKLAATATVARPPASSQSLPYAQGKRFATLDEYLAFRRAQGAIDLPWYEEVEPGIFLLHTTMRPQPAPQRFTRAELARKFGFDRP